MKSFFAEFKKFITRGNVLDMAVGVVVGSAFTAIVNSLVKDILNPIIGIVGRLEDNYISLKKSYVWNAVIKYGGIPFLILQIPYVVSLRRS